MGHDRSLRRGYEDIDVGANPDNIHMSEFFELDIPVTVSNAALDINNLPTGCFYSELWFASEQNGVLTDGIINNIDIEGQGRQWLKQGDKQR